MTFTAAELRLLALADEADDLRRGRPRNRPSRNRQVEASRERRRAKRRAEYHARKMRDAEQTVIILRYLREHETIPGATHDAR